MVRVRIWLGYGQVSVLPLPLCEPDGLDVVSVLPLPLYGMMGMSSKASRFSRSVQSKLVFPRATQAPSPSFQHEPGHIPRI